MAVSGSIDGERRRKDLVELLEDGGEISIEGARVRFDVSAMTIRRDLEMLELDGLVRRVRGGAIAPAHARSYDDRLATHIAAKRSIAKKALTLVPRQGAVAFDASTTVHELAESLNERDGLTVTTNSMQTFQALGRVPGVDAQLTGGTPEPTTSSLVGPFANANARLLITRVFFSSADGIDPELGTSEASLAEAEVKAHFAAASDRTVLCIDSSKLGRRSMGIALDLDRITTLITELAPDDSRLDPYRSRVELI